MKKAAVNGGKGDRKSRKELTADYTGRCVCLPACFLA